MRNKTSKTKEELTQYYRWQFLRRNEYYQNSFVQHFNNLKQFNKEGLASKSFIRTIQKDLEDGFGEVHSRMISGYKEAMKIFLKSGRVWDFCEAQKRFFYYWYGINSIFDYRIEEPEKLMRISGLSDFSVAKGTMRKVFGAMLEENQLIANDCLYEYEKVGEPPYDSSPGLMVKAFTVVVNGDAKWSEIQRQLKIWYDDIRRERKKSGIPKPKKVMERTDAYDRYLEVYDYYKKKMGPTRIGKLLSRSPKDVDKDRVKADKLIDGGYRKIIF